MMPRIRRLYDDIDAVECESLGVPKALLRLNPEDQDADASALEDDQELTSVIGEWLQFLWACDCRNTFKRGHWASEWKS